MCLFPFISGHSPVPSEKFAPRYKENGGNAAFLTTDCPDGTDHARNFRRQLEEGPLITRIANRGLRGYHGWGAQAASLFSSAACRKALQKS